VLEQAIDRHPQRRVALRDLSHTRQGSVRSCVRCMTSAIFQVGSNAPC
jgi:hypothetical protein